MFEEQLISLSEKIRKQEELVKTEGTTKTAFIMPFINSILGYDIFNPSEVIPEFICDVGTRLATAQKQAGLLRTGDGEAAHAKGYGR